jgi:lipopolysaccharide transport system ATP-binding protein
VARRLGGRRLASTDDPSHIWALRDVSCDIMHGEAVGLIGRNGAGKSTLLRILSRITPPTTGSAMIHGRIGSLLEVGTGFHPELTGRENIYLNGAILGMRKAEIDRKFDEIVAFAEIETFLDTPVKHYSSGMYVRLAFAVAAHLEPEILLVDEVLAVGDAHFQKKCLGKIGEVTTEGRTVVLVSHNMAAVQNLCSTALVLDGELVFAGPCERAIETYLALGSRATEAAVPGFACLADHPGRPPGQPIILQSVGLLAVPGRLGYRDRVQTGDDLVFEIGYDCGAESLDYAVLAISSALGERVCTVGTHLDPEFGGTMRGRGLLHCAIPALPLVAGDYRVFVALGTRLPYHNRDAVTDALAFHVEFGDYFGTGTTLLPGQGHLAVSSRWSIVG